jgi:hypothetical protein
MWPRLPSAGATPLHSDPLPLSFLQYEFALKPNPALDGAPTFWLFQRS